MENTSHNSSPANAGNSSGTSRKPSKLLGNLFILISAIFWGLNVPFTKALIAPDWMNSYAITAVRLVGGAALMWIASIFIRCEKIQRSDWVRLILGGVIGLFGFIFLFVMSLTYANPIDVSIIMTLPPMFVILIGVLFLHRRPSWLEYVGVAVSFAGALVVIFSNGSGHAGSHNVLGLTLAVISAVCYAFYLVILEKPTQNYHPVALLRWVFLFAAVPALCLIPDLVHSNIMHTSQATPWLEIIFILLCPTFIAYFLVQPAIKSIGSELVSIYQYLVPVVATISAVVMHLDKLHWIQVVAMAIIILGMLATNLGKRRSHHP